MKKYTRNVRLSNYFMKRQFIHILSVQDDGLEMSKAVEKNIQYIYIYIYIWKTKTIRKYSTINAASENLQGHS